jgi:hypothetical protein
VEDTVEVATEEVAVSVVAVTAKVVAITTKVAAAVTITKVVDKVVLVAGSRLRAGAGIDLSASCGVSRSHFTRNFPVGLALGVLSRC